jgi:hypothetical protein
MFRLIIVIYFVFIQFHCYSQLPRLIEFEYEVIEYGPFGNYIKKIELPIVEVRNDTLIAEFYFSGLPNPINYGTVENSGDTILLSIRGEYNWMHHCKGGCYFKVRYKVKIFKKKHFILDRTFRSSGGYNY